MSYGECKQEPDSEMTRPSPPNTIEEIIATMELNNKRLDELTSRINIEVFDRLDNKTA